MAKQEADSYNVALEHFPEFAAQIGILISCFAMLESYVHLLVSRLTGVPEADAFIFTGSFINFRARIELLESLAKRRDASIPSVRIAKYFVALLREATDVRNRYAHGRYSLTFEGGRHSPTSKKIMSIDTSLFDAGKKTKNVVRDLSDIKAEVARFKVIICEIHAYLYRDEAPAI